MTKEWTPRATGWRALLAAALMVVAATEARAIDSGPHATDPWRDPATGIAIGGYDPVAYFVEHAPHLGERSNELTVRGVTWWFESAANRAVFARDPDVYTPRYGARDPVLLAEGYEALGSPNHWLIEQDRLYLFVSPENRARWMAASDDERARAEANWPAVVEATR